MIFPGIERLVNFMKKVRPINFAGHMNSLDEDTPKVVYE